MDFIDKQNYLAFGAFDFAHHCLQALFEFAAVFGAGDEESQVELYQFFATQRFRHIAGSHAACEPFRDRCFADARFPDQDRIVLRATRQDLDDARDLGVAADDGIELVLAGTLGERTGEPRKRARLGVAFRVADLALLDIREDSRERGAVNAVSREKFRRRSRMFGDSEQQMFGRDELVVERC